jgi:hypothetical protein
MAAVQICGMDIALALFDIFNNSGGGLRRISKTEVAINELGLFKI